MNMLGYISKVQKSLFFYKGNIQLKTEMFSKKSHLHMLTLIATPGSQAQILLIEAPIIIGFHYGYLCGKLIIVAVLIESWCFAFYQVADNELHHTLVPG